MAASRTVSAIVSGTPSRDRRRRPEARADVAAHDAGVVEHVDAVRSVAGVGAAGLVGNLGDGPDAAAVAVAVGRGAWRLAVAVADGDAEASVEVCTPHAASSDVRVETAEDAERRGGG